MFERQVEIFEIKNMKVNVCTSCTIRVVRYNVSTCCTAVRAVHHIFVRAVLCVQLHDNDIQITSLLHL